MITQLERIHHMVYYIYNALPEGFDDSLRRWAVVSGMRTTFVETHLDLDAANRQSQLAELLRQFGDQPNVILSGDFNQATIDEFDQKHHIV